jgi:uncharacterized protein YndB with AHSA1/START domain/predicted SnoaL-like aldol condensation-catalyzing enzyme
MDNAISKRIELKVPLSKVWEALTDYTQFGQWFGVKLTGPFVLGQPTRGKITHPGYEHVTFEVVVQKMEREHLFSFTWHPYAVDPSMDYSRELPTRVEFTLQKTAMGTVLTVMESGFENIPPHRRAEAFRMNEGGWTKQMENIKAYVANDGTLKRGQPMTKKDSAKSFLTMVADRDVRAAYDKFISPTFIHHNQYFKGDRHSLMIGMEEAAKKNPYKILEIKKAFEDGDTVITLSHVRQNQEDLGGAVVHIFRFEHDKVVELWDLGQPVMKDSMNEHGVF